MTLAVDPAGKEVALRWHAEFQVGPKAKEVTLAGSNYNGLGMHSSRSSTRWRRT